MIIRDMVVGVDLDEVLFDSGKLELAFLNTLNNTNYSFEYYATHFWDLWGPTVKEMRENVKKYHESGFLNKAEPVEGAVEGIDYLIDIGITPGVITGRSVEMRTETEDLLNKYFFGKFATLDFANSYLAEGEPIPKSVLCKKRGMSLMIDDSPSYSIECAKEGIWTFLFNHVRNQHVVLLPNMERVYGWLGKSNKPGVIHLV